LFERNGLRVTVNKKFAETFTTFDEGDEIVLVPNTPKPPSTPDVV
jgi:molybdopterin converting factor small subunit